MHIHGSNLLAKEFLLWFISHFSLFVYFISLVKSLTKTKLLLSSLYYYNEMMIMIIINHVTYSHVCVCVKKDKLHMHVDLQY
jgi:hypothetical protein